jgi:hypothetical protein
VKNSAASWKTQLVINTSSLASSKRRIRWTVFCACSGPDPGPPIPLIPTQTGHQPDLKSDSVPIQSGPSSFRARATRRNLGVTRKLARKSLCQ